MALSYNSNAFFEAISDCKIKNVLVFAMAAVDGIEWSFSLLITPPATLLFGPKTPFF